METNESGKKVALEELSKEELIKRCKGLLAIAQKAKQAKDALQEENSELKNKLKTNTSNNEAATSEIIENLTQQKLVHVSTIEDLKQQIFVLNNKLEKYREDFQSFEEKNNILDNENVSYKRQTKRLTDENEQLLAHLESLEKQLEECKSLGLEQQEQLLVLEKNNKSLQDTNQKLQNDNQSNQTVELQKMLSVSLAEVKKLNLENVEMKEKIENLKMNLSEKDKNILCISEELKQTSKVVEELTLEKEQLQKDDSLEAIINNNEYLKEENKQLSQNIAELEEISRTLKERLKSYHSKIVKLAGNVKLLKEDKNDILNLFKTYTNQVEEWKEQLYAASLTLFQHVNQITDQNSELQKENELLKENNAKFVEQLKAHKTDDEKSKEMVEIDDLKAENQRLAEDISQMMTMQDSYRSQIESLNIEKDAISNKLEELIEKHQAELKVFDDQSKKDTAEIQTRTEENERICIEYRKIITKLEEDVNANMRQAEELKQQNFALQGELEHLKENEKEFADKTSEEIMKLVQENARLLQLAQKIEDAHSSAKEANCQTEETDNSDMEEAVTSLRRENSELLTEMNVMNQALKERGETISKFQAHCEEIMKKLQIYETQANKNVDSITEKDEIIKNLQGEIDRLKTSRTGAGQDQVDNAISQKDDEINELKNEIEVLKEKLNSNMDNSYAESESMSTSTISRTDEVNRWKELEGSWEERYGKLRTLAVKLKGKVRDLTAELLKEQNEKNDIQQKCASNAKTVASLQAQSDKLEDDLEMSRKQAKEYSIQIESAALEISRAKQKLLDNNESLTALRKELEELKTEKVNTEVWKKQIVAKIQTLRKELEANKILNGEYESKIAKLTADLAEKEKALQAESVGHKHTKSSLEHSINERMKNSVLSLEMQDYERSVKDLSQKLDKKQEQINKLKSQVDAQKTTASALREQNKLLEERAEEMKNEANVAQAEVATLKKHVSDLEEAVSQKEGQLEDVTQVLESIRSENEELSTELSKAIAEHQKVNNHSKAEREQLRSQMLGLQQSLRESQDTLKLKEDELRIVQSDYNNYKVRAQSVLRQNQSRDVGLEEKLFEEVSTVKGRCEAVTSELNESKAVVETLKNDVEKLMKEKGDIYEKYQEAITEIEDLKCLYDQLTNKHQQIIIEHGETVRSLKIHAETLAQCYRQQLSEQEVRHNREIIELQSKIEKAPSPTELPLPLPSMPREEGEGSESTENTNKNQMHPLERLLGTDSEQEMAFMKKQLSEEESKVMHLTALLADTEQDLAKHAQMNKLLKEEIRRQQRSVEREKHAENLEYLKNVVFKFVTLQSGDERGRLVPVLNTILKLSPEETQKLNLVARGDPGMKGWTNYLPLWSSPKS